MKQHDCQTVKDWIGNRFNTTCYSELRLKIDLWGSDCHKNLIWATYEQQSQIWAIFTCSVNVAFSKHWTNFNRNIISYNTPLDKASIFFWFRRNTHDMTTTTSGSQTEKGNRYSGRWGLNNEHLKYVGNSDFQLLRPDSQTRKWTSAVSLQGISGISL